MGVGACGDTHIDGPGPTIAAPAGADDLEGSGGGGRPVDHVRSNGVAYEVTCGEPAVGSLSQIAMPIDPPDARFTRAVAVEGESPNVLLALEAAGRVERCPDATWVLAMAFMETDDEHATRKYARLRCEVPVRTDDLRCIEGGPFWFSTDPSEDGTEGDGRSAVWIAANGVEPAWRADPLEVIAREARVSPDVPDFYTLRRVGLRVVRESPSEVLVEVLHQDVIESEGDGRRGHQQREHHTLRRLAGRAGWYPVAYIVADYGQGDASDSTLDAAWADGVVRVLVDVDRR